MTTLRQFLDDHGWEICKEEPDTYGPSWFPIYDDEYDFTEVDVDFRRAFVKIKEAVGD